MPSGSISEYAVAFLKGDISQKMRQEAFSTGKEREMKKLRLLMFFLFALGLELPYAFGAGDAAKGKALFMNPEFAGSTTGKSCSSCHPDGQGAGKAADKKDVRDIINACIVNALHGKAIPPNSIEMNDVVAYLKSVKGKQ
jgi:mono/diheme cytochrome c family protein